MADFTVQIFPTPWAARSFLRWLAERAALWVFDVETYDALYDGGKVRKGRKGVAVDPCHPDFRVRGVAIAYTAHHAAWIELMPWEEKKAAARKLLSPAFGSPALKGGFNAGFDEEALVYPTTREAWVDKIVNRGVDGMLANIALGDVTQDSNKLSACVQRVFGATLTWEDIDKTQMRDLPLRDVAHGAGGDAVWTYRLIDNLYRRAGRDEYLDSLGTTTIRKGRRWPTQRQGTD
jgi:hypothetical protein